MTASFAFSQYQKNVICGFESIIDESYNNKSVIIEAFLSIVNIFCNVTLE
jgi:hypothetical protein